MFKPFSCNNIMKTKYLSPINLLLLVLLLQNAINTFYNLYYNYWDLSSDQALLSGTLPFQKCDVNSTHFL